MSESGGWLSRLKRGLGRSSAKLGEGLVGIFTKRRLGEEELESLEELLLAADFGLNVTGAVIADLRKTRFGQEVTDTEVRETLAAKITEILSPVAQPLTIDRSKRPHVVLVAGVNGSGKTTTIGKLAKHYSDRGLKVHLAAGDTFRAAAVEQLKIWGERTGSPVTARATGADAAGLAMDAINEARAEGADLLLIDTAGRLQNRNDLMAELEKVRRVIGKADPSAPHSVLLVLDATVGQNAHQQVEIFRAKVGVTGLVMTKLDGTARGGVLVSLAQKYGLPIHAIGVGETAEDLQSFDAGSFARSLVGLGG
jgi:fused signal recognition particle receptor